MTFRGIYEGKVMKETPKHLTRTTYTTRNVSYSAAVTEASRVADANRHNREDVLEAYAIRVWK